MVKYYGFYSNKSRGMRLKQGIVRPGHEPVNESEMNVEIIDVLDYQPCSIGFSLRNLTGLAQI